VIHFKAPPASGKTSTTQILYWNYTKLHGKGSAVYFCFTKKSVAESGEFLKFWTKNYKVAGLLILDEAQKAYSDTTLKLWGVVKGLLAKEPKYAYLFIIYIKVILFDFW
jgi:hypothetical protein